jgi:hypothetical protein
LSRCQKGSGVRLEIKGVRREKVLVIGGFMELRQGLGDVRRGKAIVKGSRRGKGGCTGLGVS